MEKKETSQHSFHLAGIVPLISESGDFGMMWDDSLTPIAPNYTAIERAVVEAAWAGCETIWIVANDDVSPLIKHRLGEWIQDPRFLGFRKRADDKRIPIFYIPLKAKDRGVRDCLPWNILYGTWAAYWVCRRLSKWVIPDRYYVSFPYGVYYEDSPNIIREEISTDKPFYFSHNGKTVKDGKYLGFTYTGEQFIKYKSLLRTFKYDAIKLKLEDIFGSDIIEKEATILEVPWYYSIDSWEGYREYLGSEDSAEIKHPGKEIIPIRQWNAVGEDDV